MSNGSTKSGRTEWGSIFPEWKDECTALDWVSGRGDYELAVGYSELFWPCFVEYDGMVFSGEELDQESIENIESWRKKLSGDKTEVERMLNHLHIHHIHRNGLPANDAIFDYLGRRLKEMWAAKLAVDFPKDKFTVEYYSGKDTALEDYQVTFFKNRESA